MSRARTVDRSQNHSPISTLMILLVGLLLVFSGPLIAFTGDSGPNMELREQTPLGLSSHQLTVGNYTLGGYHLASGDWWERPMPFNVSTSDSDGDGTPNNVDPRPSDPAIPAPLGQRPNSCQLEGLPCPTQLHRPSFNRAPDWDPDTTEKDSSIGWADIDRDGDLDLVRANGHTGSNQWALALGDVNGDGYIDAVSTTHMSTRLFLNNQGSLSTSLDVYLTEDGVLASTPSTVGGNWHNWSYAESAWGGIALADMDGDLDLDMAISTFSSLRLFINTGTGYGTASTWSTPTTSSTGLAWGDIDSDGDLDLAVVYSNAKVRVYTNTGTTLSSTGYWESDSSVDAKSVDWGDIDGDGREDLLVGTTTNASLFLNSATGLSTSSNWTSIGGGRTESISLGDIDGDGDLDLLTGGGDGPDYIYLNVDGELQRSPSWDTAASDVTVTTAFADIDGDGDLDISIGTEDSIKVHYNSGSVLSGAAGWESATAPNVHDVALADLNGDGFLDMVVDGYKIGVFMSFEGMMNTTNEWSSDINGVEVVEVGDMDGDGDFDIIAGTPTQFHIIWNQNGLFSNSSKSTFSHGASWLTDIALGDVDGDGDLDIALGGSHTTAIQGVFFNNGGSFNTTADWDTGGGRAFAVNLADMNGDGWLDFIYADYHSAKVKIYWNQQGTLSNSTSLDISIPSPRSFDVGDIDADGDLDIFVGSWCAPHCASRVYKNVNANFQLDTTISIGGTTTATILADMDQDGDLDAVEAISGGRAYIYINNGTHISSTPYWTSSTNSDKEALAAGDVDHDGTIDLIIGGGYDKIGRYIGASDQDVDGEEDGSDAYPGDPTQVTDIDGDGFGDHAAGRLFDSCTGYWGDSWRDRWGCPDMDGDGQSDLFDSFMNKPTQWEDSDGDGLGDNWDGSGPARPSHWPGEEIIGQGLVWNSDPSPLDYDNDGFEDQNLANVGSLSPYDTCPLVYGTSFKNKNGCPDSDGDGVDDHGDSHPGDATQEYDSDNDGYGDNASGNNPDSCPQVTGNSTIDVLGCPDSDGDGYSHYSDFDDNDSAEWSDMDNDGVGDNGDQCPFVTGNIASGDDIGCPDSDGDGYADRVDDMPNDASQYQDSDGDGYGDNQQGGQAGDESQPDKFPSDSTQWSDYDGDGYGDNQQGTNPDIFPSDPTQWQDSDGDGYGDNSSGNNPDLFPSDSTQWSDYDGDGFGNNQQGTDPDIFPSDPTQWQDSDGDGYGDNSSGNNPDLFPSDSTQWSDYDGDGFGDNQQGTNRDVFPNDPTQWLDSDDDGYGDNNSDDCISSSGTSWRGDLGCPDADGDGWADKQDLCPYDFGVSDLPIRGCSDRDEDGVADVADEYPDDASESTDSDGDGLGDNADEYPNDWDNDGHESEDDWDDTDAGEWQDSDADGVGDNSDPWPDDPQLWSDVDGDGYADQTGSIISDDCVTTVGNSTIFQQGCPDLDGDGMPDVLDSDIDGDGVTNDNEIDASNDVMKYDPFNYSSKPADLDGDNIPDILDFDMDNDGFPNEFEEERGSDELDAKSTPFNVYGDQNTGLYYIPGDGFSSQYDPDGYEISLSLLVKAMTSEFLIPIVMAVPLAFAIRRKKRRYKKIRSRLANVDTAKELEGAEAMIDKMILKHKVTIEHGVLLRNLFERRREELLDNSDFDPSPRTGSSHGGGRRDLASKRPESIASIGEGVKSSVSRPSGRPPPRATRFGLDSDD